MLNSTNYYGRKKKKKEGSMGQPIFLQLTSTNAVLGIPLA